MKTFRRARPRLVARAGQGRHRARAHGTPDTAENRGYLLVKEGNLAQAADTK
ncbi:hypothetical protein [Archangium sp.]|uniref:hypothetical protein n=1 Tax=Archangium sp. TaxID=1872627 RepID=UPI00286D26EA|nr:hypothetical protein [Archangium sp.]